MRAFYNRLCYDFFCNTLDLLFSTIMHDKCYYELSSSLLYIFLASPAAQPLFQRAHFGRYEKTIVATQEYWRFCPTFGDNLVQSSARNFKFFSMFVLATHLFLLQRYNFFFVHFFCNSMYTGIRLCVHRWSNSSICTFFNIKHSVVNFINMYTFQNIRRLFTMIECAQRDRHKNLISI